MTAQPAILASVPPHAAFLFLDCRSDEAPTTGLAQLTALSAADHLLVGISASFLDALGAEVPNVGPFPELTAPSARMPHTPSHLLLRISGADPGEVLHRERAVLEALPAFTVVDRVDGFLHGESRDLTGYEDGTENPGPDERGVVALRSGSGAALDGSSMVAIQRWLHDLDGFAGMPKSTQDHTIGRERISNEELDDAPKSAHVKRTAQEDFSPEAFIWRRSMPWRDQRGAGLVFVSFSATLDPFEAQCRRMIGEDDGIVDALFTFTQPVTGAAFWCPPIHSGCLNLSALTPQVTANDIT